MEEVFGIILLACTSLTAIVIASRRRTADKTSLVRAAAETLECIGTGAVFLAANIVFAMALLLLVRAITPWFITVYFLDDPLFVAASFLQGVAFKFWWRSGSGL
jgi:hypothetical protein